MCDPTPSLTHVVPAGLVGGTVLETVVSDADIERTIAVEDTLDTPPMQPSYTKAVMNAFRRAKRVSEKNNERCRAIVESLRKERENTASVEQGEPHRESKQKTIADFW